VGGSRQDEVFHAWVHPRFGCKSVQAAKSEHLSEHTREVSLVVRSQWSVADGEKKVLARVAWGMAGIKVFLGMGSEVCG
jgi:hypothetical protein